MPNQRTRSCKLSVSIWTLPIKWWMSQTGHDPHGNNPVNYYCHYHWARSCLLCQPDNSNLLINVSNRALSTQLKSRELSKPLPLGGILFAMSTRTIEIYWSMSQTGHYPHDYNPVNYQSPHQCVWSHLLCNWTISVYRSSLNSRQRL